MTDSGFTNGRFTPDEVAVLVPALVSSELGCLVPAVELPSYSDQNFRLETGRGSLVAKIANSAATGAELELENAMFSRLAGAEEVPDCPRVLRNTRGEELTSIPVEGGAPRWLRLVTFLPGRVMAKARPLSTELLDHFGTSLGAMDRALDGFAHEGAKRELAWDLQNLADLAGSTRLVRERPLRAAVEAALLQFFAVYSEHGGALRRSVIHNDANDHNVLVDGDRVTGILDFGDAVWSCTVFNLGVAAAYAILDAENPLADLVTMVAGYHRTWPLQENELAMVFPAIGARWAQSVLMAEQTLAAETGADPNYIAVSQRPVREALCALHAEHPVAVENRLRVACGYAPHPEPPARDRLRAARKDVLGPSLSLSYSEPLVMVRGRGAYLFDAQGRGHADGVNNVCHVGHCHPHVVRAATSQLATLNTNTRYLHPELVDYATRLTALFPDPLSVCFLVCSGSEANELALRMARAHTGREDVVVLDAGYHGNTTALVELSPYKHNGPGGRGTPEHVHVADLPNPYRRPEGMAESEMTIHYARSVGDACARAAAREGSRGGAAAFFAESISGCGGQVEFPAGYLKAAQAEAQAAGALYVADEVQVGFGRVGSHMWAFETHGVVPDIVTLGKPIGNGHPMAAVVTTAAIAGTFANGMEYFNTFGGNPVSAAVGAAVLDVIETEQLQAHAASVGARLKAGLSALQERFPVLGDVRGRGLFLGIEFVADRESKKPAPEALATVVEGMKRAGFLLSIDGPEHNVLKFKPPLVFSAADAELMLAVFERVLEDATSA